MLIVLLCHDFIGGTKHITYSTQSAAFKNTKNNLFCFYLNITRFVYHLGISVSFWTCLSGPESCLVLLKDKRKTYCKDFFVLF